jgi:hypothetical protein
MSESTATPASRPLARRPPHHARLLRAIVPIGRQHRGVEGPPRRTSQRCPDSPVGYSCGDSQTCRSPCSRVGYSNRKPVPRSRMFEKTSIEIAGEVRATNELCCHGRKAPDAERTIRYPGERCRECVEPCGSLFTRKYRLPRPRTRLDAPTPGRSRGRERGHHGRSSQPAFGDRP